MMNETNVCIVRSYSLQIYFGDDGLRMHCTQGENNFLKELFELSYSYRR